MKRIFPAAAVAAALSLGACSQAQIEANSPVFISDAQALLTTLEANGSVSPGTGSTLSLVITGLEALESASQASITSGADTEATTIAALEASVKQVAADATSATVQADAKTAEALLADLPGSSSESAQTQVETTVATFLIDYLASVAPSAAAPGVSVSHVQQLIIDARKHLSPLS